MSVAWIVISETDMNDYVEKLPFDAFKTKGLQAGQSDPFTNLMHATADRIRGIIGLNYTLSATPYALPPSIKWIGCLLIAEVMQGRLVVMDQNVANFLKGHEQNLKDARAYLDKIMEGDATVEEPTDPLTESMQSAANSSIELVHADTRVITRETMDGI